MFRCTKSIIGCTLIGCSMFMGLQPVNATERMELDASHTYPSFWVSHLGFSLMHGRFNQTAGYIEMNGDKPVALDVVIQSDSIDTGHAKRDSHLRGKEFFNTTAFPTLHYRSKRIIRHDKTTATVEGELTLLGITKPVVLNVDSIACGTHPLNQKYTCGFGASASLKRSAFGMKAHLPAVGDDIKIRIEGEAARQVDVSGPRK